MGWIDAPLDDRARRLATLVLRKHYEMEFYGTKVSGMCYCTPHSAIENILTGLDNGEREGDFRPGLYWQQEGEVPHPHSDGALDDMCNHPRLEHLQGVSLIGVVNDEVAFVASIASQINSMPTIFNPLSVRSLDWGQCMTDECHHGKDGMAWVGYGRTMCPRCGRYICPICAIPRYDEFRNRYGCAHCMEDKPYANSEEAERILGREQEPLQAPPAPMPDAPQADARPPVGAEEPLVLPAGARARAAAAMREQWLIIEEGTDEHEQYDDEEVEQDEDDVYDDEPEGGDEDMETEEEHRALRGPTAGRFGKTVLLGAGITGSWAFAALVRLSERVIVFDDDEVDVENYNGLWPHLNLDDPMPQPKVYALTEQSHRDAAELYSVRVTDDPEAFQIQIPTETDLLVLCPDNAPARKLAVEQLGEAHARVLDIRATPAGIVMYAFWNDNRAMKKAWMITLEGYPAAQPCGHHDAVPILAGLTALHAVGWWAFADAPEGIFQFSYDPHGYPDEEPIRKEVNATDAEREATPGQAHRRVPARTRRRVRRRRVAEPTDGGTTVRPIEQA